MFIFVLLLPRGCLFYIYFSGEKLPSFVVRDPGFKGKRELADCVNFL